MEERKILISGSKMEALIGLLGSCSELWESNADPGNPNQHLAIDMLKQGIVAVNRIIEDGQKKEGGQQ